MKASNIWSAQTLSWAALFLPFIGIGALILGSVMALFSDSTEWKEINPDEDLKGSSAQGEEIIWAAEAPTHINAVVGLFPYCTLAGGLIGLILPRRYFLYRGARKGRPGPAAT